MVSTLPSTPYAINSDYPWTVYLRSIRSQERSRRTAPTRKIDSPETQSRRRVYPRSGVPPCHRLLLFVSIFCPPIPPGTLLLQRIGFCSRRFHPDLPIPPLGADHILLTRLSPLRSPWIRLSLGCSRRRASLAVVPSSHFHGFCGVRL